MSVLAVMRSLRSKVDAGNLKPYCFVEVNGLKLASPENIYKVIYEALTGHRVGWKKALQLLNERFSEGKKIGKEDDKPCILLIDELDLLVTRNQFFTTYWTGLPDPIDRHRYDFLKLELSFQKAIILSRLKGIEAFEKQAMEFASRKVAAISGDARRALEICRHAAELADYRSAN